MSPPRDEKGRFVRADAKPTLHRQIDEATAEWLQLTAPRDEPPTRSLWPLVFFAVGLILVAVMGGWLAAVDGGLM